MNPITRRLLIDRLIEEGIINFDIPYDESSTIMVNNKTIQKYWSIKLEEAVAADTGSYKTNRLLDLMVEEILGQLNGK